MSEEAIIDNTYLAQTNKNSEKSEGILQKHQNTTCKCESGFEEERIKCLVDAYCQLLVHRAKPMPLDRYNTLLRTSELRNVQLLNIEVNTLTEELAETQILFTFIRQYIKKHPKFLEWGPPLAEIKLKSDFYSST